MKSKKYEIILSVLTILTVLVTSVGVTFSYFTGKISGTPANVNIETDVVGQVTFTDGADFSDTVDIEPGWSSSKNFSVTAAPSNHEQKVYVKMKYTNGFTDMTCSVTSSSSDSGAKGNIDLVTNETVEQEAVLVEVTFPASSEVQTKEYTITLEFPNKDENQNAQQGKRIEGKLFAILNPETLYYTDSNPNGTGTPPTAE